MKLEVVTPTGALVSVDATSVTAPGALGEFNVLAEHQAGLVMLSGGAVRYEGAESGVIYIRGGIAEVRPAGVLVLADEACTADDADRTAAEALLRRALDAGASPDYLGEEKLMAIASDRAYAEAVLRTAGH